jgi:hypothetical protein
MLESKSSQWTIGKRREDITQINDNLLISRYLLIASKYNRVLREFGFPGCHDHRRSEAFVTGFPASDLPTLKFGHSLGTEKHIRRCVDLLKY